MKTRRFLWMLFLGATACGHDGFISGVDETSSPLTADIRVAAASDDAEELSGGFMSLSSSDLEIIHDEVDQTVGLRFAGVAIPRGSTINAAWVTFTVDEAQSEATSLTIRAQAADNAATFTTADGNITSRALTTQSVAWSPPAWSTVGQAQSTPDLSAVISAVVSRAGWSSGNAIAIVIAGTGHRTAVAYEGTPASAPALHVDFTPPATTVTQDVRVNAGSDDAEQSSSGNMNLTSSDLELVNDGSDQTVGLRFNGLNIPRGATISKAYLQFVVDEANSEATSLSIRAQAVDSAPTFSTSTNDISSRAKTAAAVAWSPGAWSTLEAQQNSPDLSAVINEVTSRGGWAVGNSLAIIITGTGHRTAHALEFGSGAPLLHVEYSGGSTQPQDPPSGTTVTYNELVDTFADKIVNPERGWYTQASVGSSFSSLRSPSDPVARPAGTLALVQGDLDATASHVSSTILNNWRSMFSAARAAGVKVVFRPVYRVDDDDPTPDPTSVSRIITHISEFAPVLSENVDVIAVVQAGLLGPWGEFWENTSQPSPILRDGTWVQVVRALIDAVPPSRQVMLRRPAFKSYFLSTPSGSGVDPARIGYFNDCFLGPTVNDEGTYSTPTGSGPSQSTDFWRNYLASDASGRMVGGETCGNNDRATCSAARDDLTLFHWTFLSSGWYQPTIGASGKLASCREEIHRNLGYRFVLEQATFSGAVRPGDTLDLSVRVRNKGYTSLTNQRPIYALLTNGTTTYIAQLSGSGTDPRQWLAGQATTLTAKLKVPSSAATGNYTLGLWLPDASSSIRDRWEYAIRFANNNTWSGTTGFNRLTTALPISTSAAPNTTTPTATFVLK
jgi:hypothetical protein